MDVESDATPAPAATARVGDVRMRGRSEGHIRFSRSRSVSKTGKLIRIDLRQIEDRNAYDAALQVMQLL